MGADCIADFNGDGSFTVLATNLNIASCSSHIGIKSLKVYQMLEILNIHV